MNIEEIREYCLSKKGAEETSPFGDDSLVFKVGGKMFALVSIYSPVWINLKCNPDEVIALCEQYSCVKPGYHMNKKHWITVEAEGNLSIKILYSWIDRSYDLVFHALPASVKNEVLKI